jgi:anti-anti-sigma regulatory factor
MLQLAPGWNLDVERGPDWLFVRLHCLPDNIWDAPPLAEMLWSLGEQHFTYRLVLECDELQLLHTSLLGQLVLLHKRLAVNGGTLRLCGLSQQNRDVLRSCRLDSRFPVFANRGEAVLGQTVLAPNKPR